MSNQVELTVAQLAARMERLERAARRWKIAALGLLGLAAVGTCMGAQALEEKPAEGKEIVLHDAKGNRRLVMQIVNGKPQILFLDADGVPRSQLSGEILAFYERHQPQVVVGIEAGKPQVALYDGQGRRRARMDIDRNQPGISFLDEKGLAKVRFGVDDASRPVLPRDTQVKR